MASKQSEQPTISFDTTLVATGKNTGIVVPPEVIDALGAGRRPPVLVDLNGYSYQTTVGVMSGRHTISVSAAIRKATGLRGGDKIAVALTVTDKPQGVLVPSDLDAAFKSSRPARAFFESLSNSLQRYHVDNINGAKTAETRQRRIDKAIDLFLAGKRR
jgi:hypothetical protein